MAGGGVCRRFTLPRCRKHLATYLIVASAEPPPAPQTGNEDGNVVPALLWSQQLASPLPVHTKSAPGKPPWGLLPLSCTTLNSIRVDSGSGSNPSVAAVQWAGSIWNAEHMSTSAM